MQVFCYRKWFLQIITWSFIGTVRMQLVETEWNIWWYDLKNEK